MAFDVPYAASALALDTSNVFAEQNEDVIPFYLFFFFFTKAESRNLNELLFLYVGGAG